MIEKIINKYLSDTLIRCIKSWALQYGVDLKIMPRKTKIKIYAKDRKYKDTYFKSIFEFKKQDAILFLCNLKETHKDFSKYIEDFQSKECR